jgi:hypothetical protein
MWSLASPGLKRISGVRKFHSPLQKDFCNNIRNERSFHNHAFRELPKWLVPAPRYTRDLRTIRFLRRTIQFYDGRAIDLCELMRALYLIRMRSEETKG